MTNPMRVAGAAVLCAGLAGAAAGQAVVDGVPDCVVLAVGEAFVGPDGAAYAVEATSSGADCQTAALLLAIRGPDGLVLWTDSFAADQMFGFDMATQPDEMAAALELWIEQPGEAPQSTADLPPWTDPAADGPTSPNPEFPFFADAWIDGETWEAIRAEGLPLYCYIQGVESIRCVALDPDSLRIEPLGVQTFPG